MKIQHKKHNTKRQHSDTTRTTLSAGKQPKTMLTPKKTKKKIFSELNMEKGAGISILCKDIIYERCTYKSRL